MRRFSLSLLLLHMFLTCLLQACRPLTPPLRFQANRPVTTMASHPHGPRLVPTVPWWEQFNSPTLTHLVEQALTDNFSIRRAWARLEQARTTVADRRASRFPVIGLDAGYTRTQTDTANDSSNTFSTGPAAAYEIDLWGSITADIAAAQLTAQASRYDLDTAAMSVAAEVAGTWTDLIATRGRLALARRQLELNATVLDLLELRFENAMSTALDVLQQREVVARAQAEIPPVENRIITLENNLRLLLGTSTALERSFSDALPMPLPPLPAGGLPAKLLEMRPDVQAARARLLSADWNATGAEANLLPTLSLTGGFLFRDAALDLILQNWILSLGTTLSATLFDGGKKKAAVAHADAVVTEQLAAYEETVATAIVEVENRVADEQHQAQHVALLNVELNTARQALMEARRRYINGLDPFIPFLTEQVNVQSLESRLIEQKAALIRNRIALYRALGGNWTEEISPR